MSRQLALADPAQPSVPAPVGPDTVGLVGEWLAGRKPSTVQAYTKDLNHFARWFGYPPGAAAYYLVSQSGSDGNRIVLSYKNSMVDANLSSATIARRLASLKSLVKLARLTLGVTWSIEVDGPRPEPRVDVRGPDPAEFKKLWKAAKAGDAPRDRRNRAIVAVLYGLGLRRSEAVGLDLVDVDFRAAEVLVLGKGRREKTRIALSAEVSKALGDWVLVRGPDPGPLFTSGDGGRLTGESVARLVTKLGIAAKLPRRVRPHGLRHSAITSALARGLTVREVRAFSRHMKIETVMRYDDERDAPAAAVAKKIGESLR